MMLDLTPRRMRLLCRYLEAGMNMEEIEAAIIEERPPTKWCLARREQVAGMLADGISHEEIAASLNIKVQSLQHAICTKNIRAPVKVVEVEQAPQQPEVPAPRPSAYSLAQFDPVIARACRVYEASRRSA